MQDTTYCPNHSDTPTNLRCSRCEVLVCPRCMVHSPVGVRCKECGQGTRLPTYDVSRPLLARAILAGLLMGLAGGLVAGLVVRELLFGLFYLASMAGFGYLLAEVISLAAERKRGRTLQMVAAGGAVVAYAVIAFITVFAYGSIDLFDMLGGGIAVYVAFLRLR